MQARPDPWRDIAATIGATLTTTDPAHDGWDQHVRQTPDEKPVAEFTGAAGTPHTLVYEAKTGRSVALGRAADVRFAKALTRRRALRPNVAVCRPSTGTHPRPRRPRAAGRARARAPGSDDPSPPDPPPASRDLAEEQFERGLSPIQRAWLTAVRELRTPAEFFELAAIAQSRGELQAEGRIP